MEHFTTPRTIARDWAAADLNAAFAIYGRDEVTRWLGPQPRHPVRSLAQMRQVLDRRIALARQQPHYGLWPIELDPDKIADVLINLLANAVKFTPDGGTIRVAAFAEPGTSDWVRVSVSDEGTGVPAGDQQYLFEPFFTGFDTLRHSSGDYQFGKRGLGLGLWLVKTFVEMHGGRIWVESTLGKGSTFQMELPTRAAFYQRVP